MIIQGGGLSVSLANNDRKLGDQSSDNDDGLSQDETGNTAGSDFVNTAANASFAAILNGTSTRTQSNLQDQSGLTTNQLNNQSQSNTQASSTNSISTINDTGIDETGGLGSIDPSNFTSPPKVDPPLYYGETFGLSSGNLYKVVGEVVDDAVDPNYYHYHVVRSEVGPDGTVQPYETTITSHGPDSSISAQVNISVYLKISKETGVLEEGIMSVLHDGRMIARASIGAETPGVIENEGMTTRFPGFGIEENIFTDLNEMFQASLPVQPQPVEDDRGDVDPLPDDVDIGPGGPDDGAWAGGGHGPSGGGGGGSGFGGLGGGGSGGWSGGGSAGGVEGYISENGPLSGDIDVVEPDPPPPPDIA